MRVLYYNCSAGICGDMNLGAMIDLGVDPNALLVELKRLPLEGWEIRWEKDDRSGISGTRVDVILEGESANHSHSHSHGHSDHDHTHDHSHAHHDEEDSAEHGHQHEHRTFQVIREMIRQSGLSEKVKDDSVEVFRVLAEAEGAVHNKPAEEVHFHEVGAIDSIIDIVGAAICWELLGVDAIAASTVELGGGTVQCAHGRMPVPAPATARLVESMSVSLNATNKEATTPTGAALLRGKKCRFHERVAGRQLKAGTGIGQRKDPIIPNVLHVSLMETEEADTSAHTFVWEVAVNLDDMTPEHVAYLCEQLLEAGALDVWQTAATFKKGRVGVIVAALVAETDLPAVESACFRHSLSLGLRKRRWDRVVLDRTIETLETSLGPVRLKVARDAEGRVCRRKPEYEDCKALAREHGLSQREVMRIIDEVLSLKRD